APGGRPGITPSPPIFSWLWPWSPKDSPGNRTGDGVAAALVVEEVTAGGFTLVKVIEDGPGRGPLKSSSAIRKPEVSPRARLNLGAPLALLAEGLERTRTALAAR